jgi:putative redox protein
MGGEVTALGIAGPFTLVVDRPEHDGGGGLGLNGGQLLYLAVAGCVSNDLFREARSMHLELSRVQVRVRGDFGGRPARSEPIHYDVEVQGPVPDEALQKLVRRVDGLAEIPNSLRLGTPVLLDRISVGHTGLDARLRGPSVAGTARLAGRSPRMHRQD